MDSLLTGIANWKTTLTGLVTAIVIYMAGVGNKLPETKQEWTAFVLGVLALLLGIASKDATTGSRPKMIVLALLLPLALAGCSLPGAYAGMSPEQIAAAVKDKSATASCAKGVYAGATLTVIHANADKGVPGTSVTIDDNCKTTVTTNDAKKPAP